MSGIKKSISVVLALMVIVSLFAIAPATAGAKTCGDYEYKKVNKGAVMITGYDGSASMLTIPEKLDDLKVVSIGPKAFYYNNFKKVVIPDTVRDIKNDAFGANEKLVELKIGKSVKTIGKNAFSDCGKLKKVVLPDSVVVIKAEAFARCGKLSKFVFGKSVRSIENAAFFDSGITKVVLPKSIKSIHVRAFLDCRKITKFYIPKKNKYYFTKSGVLYNKKKSILLNYPRKKTSKSFTIPNNIKSISSDAICGNSYLKSITFGKKVKSLGSYSIAGCTKLQKVKFKAALKSISPTTFFECYSLNNVVVRKGSKITFVGTTKGINGQGAATVYSTNNSYVIPVKTTVPLNSYDRQANQLVLTAQNFGNAVITVKEGGYWNNTWAFSSTKNINVKVF